MNTAITVIDVGPTHKGVVHLLREHVYASECRRRGVKFLPAQVVRRLVVEMQFDEATSVAINPFAAHLQ